MGRRVQGGGSQAPQEQCYRADPGVVQEVATWPTGRALVLHAWPDSTCGSNSSSTEGPWRALLTLPGGTAQRGAEAAAGGEQSGRLTSVLKPWVLEPGSLVAPAAGPWLVPTGAALPRRAGPLRSKDKDGAAPPGAHGSPSPEEPHCLPAPLPLSPSHPRPELPTLCQRCFLMTQAGCQGGRRARGTWPGGSCGPQAGIVSLPRFTVEVLSPEPLGMRPYSEGGCGVISARPPAALAAVLVEGRDVDTPTQGRRRVQPTTCGTHRWPCIPQKESTLRTPWPCRPASRTPSRCCCSPGQTGGGAGPWGGTPQLPLRRTPRGQ